MRSQTTRVVAGRVNSDGTVAVAGAYTVRRTATGNYSLTFPNDRLISVTATHSGGALGYTAHTINYSGNGCQVMLLDSANTATDRAWVFTATVVA